jgi:subtilase family serine protease
MRKASLLAAAATAIAVVAVAGFGTSAMAAPGTGSASPAAAAASAGATTRALCSTATPVRVMHCNAVVRTDIAPSAGVHPAATVSGLAPADLQSAYALPSGTAGAGQTVAIVDAQDDPNAEADLATYRSNFGLPACTTANGCFRKVNQNGATSPLPTSDAGWGGEISLDLDMVSAVCPKCNIVLVEATSASIANLGAAVNRAVTMGAKYVSNSYGGDEYSGETTDANSFYNHPGVVQTVSSGDDGFGVEFPAASNTVTAVGGTSLTRNSSTRGWGETAWSGAGSGCSAFVSKPSWQTDTGCTRRTVADVSAVADPNTGVAVFDSFGEGGWLVFGGTSASAPIIASTYALAGAPAAGTNPASFPYAHTANLNDVTSGSNGSCSPAYLCRAAAGFDGPTGLGTPATAAGFSGGGGGTTPPPGNCTSAGNKLVNGGFESGSAPWTATSGVVTTDTGEPAHAGTTKAWLDGYGTTHTDTLSQSIAIPAGCTTATLTYFLHIDTRETTTATAFDKLSVQVGTSTVGSFSNLSHNTGYVQQSVNVGNLAGSTVTLKYTGTEDSSLATSFVVDDVALTVS